jgi:hypothetical protein
MTTVPVFVAYVSKSERGIKPVIRELRRGVIVTDGTEQVFYLDSRGYVASVFSSFEKVFDTRREACRFLAGEVRREIDLLRVEADQLEFAI